MAAITTAVYTPNPQELPDYLSYSTYVTNVGGVVYTTEAVVQVPETYYGPSIPLGEGWTYGGSSSPGSTIASSTTISTALSTSSSSASSTSRSIPQTTAPSRSSIPSTSISSLPSFSSSTGIESSQTSSPAASETQAIVPQAAHKSGFSRLGTILLSVLLPVAFLVGIGVCLLAIRKKKRRTSEPSARVATYGDDGSVQRRRASGEGLVGSGPGNGSAGMGLLPFWRRRARKQSKRQSDRIIGARYGPISTTNSGNRASRIGDRAMLEDELVEMPRNEDGYEPVRLGVRGQEDWANDAEEYLHDFNDGDSAQQHAHPGRGEIQHLSRGGFEAEDDIVDSYMARTPMAHDDPAFSPTSPHTERTHTSPSTGTDHSSPLTQGTSRGKTTGAKWVTGLGIGMGVPKDRALVQNQMRRRTPRKLAVQEERNEEDDRNQSSRPPLDNRSSGAESTVSGRGWNWLNGLGIAHVFSGTTRTAPREDDGSGSGWSGQSRIPSTNIWGDSDMPGNQGPSGTSVRAGEDNDGDALSHLPPQESTTGTMRLVQPSITFGDEAQFRQEYGSLLPNEVPRSGEDGTVEDPSSPRSFIAPLPQHGTMSSFSSCPVNSNYRRRSDSLGSDDSFDRDESRESTGFRHAVLAALGFSSSHSRPESGSTSRLPSIGQTRDSHDFAPSPNRERVGAEQPFRMSSQPTDLFSLPPMGARSSDSQHPIGLGLNYTDTRTESHLSHPSQTTWNALYREHSADLELDADMLDFSSPSHMSNSRSGSVSVFASATPASTTRSPAMMSTGPMPHSEQFHPETDEPVPAIPSDKVDGTVWSQDEQREMALFAEFSSPDSLTAALLEGSLASDGDKRSNLQALAQSSTANFPLPPQRQVATSPNGLRPRPSDNALRHSAETSAPGKAESERLSESLPIPPFSSEQLGYRRQQGEKSIDAPAPASTGIGPSIFSPTSIFSTDTFGESAPGPRQIARGSRSPESARGSTSRVASGEASRRQSHSRFSHLFAEDNHSVSGLSSVEPSSGNTFSSFRQQQKTSGNSFQDDRVYAEETAGANLRPISESISEPNSRWSMASFPGQPIVPSEVYQQAVSGHTPASAFDPSRHPTASDRPLSIAVPIATRSAIGIQDEHGFDTEKLRAKGGASDMFIRDASGTANANFDIRLAPPASSKAASFLTARSHSDSARSYTDSGSTPQDSPMEIEVSESHEIRPNDGVAREDQLPTTSDQVSVPGSAGRSKFSTSTSSSAFTGNLQPVDEQFEDGVEVEDVEDEQFGLARSPSQAVLGRRSMPQLLSSRQALSSRFSGKGT